MRIRITGTRTDTEHTAALLAEVLPVLETSRFYPHRGASELGRVYLDVATVITAPSKGTRP
jgi:hypothetical protein